MTKIITRISDNLVMWVGDDLTLDSIGAHGNGWNYSQLNNTTATLIENVTLPEPWVQGAYGYANGAFIVVNQTLVNEANATALSAAQVTQIASLFASYQNAIAQPVSFTTAAGVVKTYQADPYSRGNLHDSITGCEKAGVTPASFCWVSADNTQVPFAFADLQGLAAAIFTQGAAAFVHLQALKEQVRAATTVAQVQAVVW